MIWDLDDLLEQLGIALGTTLEDIEAGKTVKRTRVVKEGPFTITSNISISSAIGDIEPYSEKTVREPLVDVFDDPDGLRVVIELPGVKKEDVNVRFLEGVLRIEITQAGRVHRKDIASRFSKGSVEVWSTKENNSVVELTFSGVHRRTKE